MSILIKGMDMPDSCNSCPFSVNGFCVVSPKRANGEAMSKRTTTNWCPLIEIPPHGDLIDRDPFIEFIKTHWDSYDQWFVEQLEARPTIIPAEEE